MNVLCTPVILTLLLDSFIFSNLVCQPPDPTTPQFCEQANATRPAESHRLCSGIPDGWRWGVTEIPVCSRRLMCLQVILNLACVLQSTWMHFPLCNRSTWYFSICWRPARLSCSPLLCLWWTLRLHRNLNRNFFFFLSDQTLYLQFTKVLSWNLLGKIWVDSYALSET